MATYDDTSVISEDKDPVDFEDTVAENLLSDGVTHITLQDAKPLALLPEAPTGVSQRPLVVYTRAQLLYLHQSPLVKPPEGMPAFKDWFGYAARHQYIACYKP